VKFPEWRQNRKVFYRVTARAYRTKTEQKCIIPWHGHAPPEARKINYNEYDSSLDIFSFGVVMVQMVVKAQRIACSVDQDVYIEEIKKADSGQLRQPRVPESIARGNLLVIGPIIFVRQHFCYFCYTCMSS